MILFAEDESAAVYSTLTVACACRANAVPTSSIRIPGDANDVIILSYAPGT